MKTNDFNNYLIKSFLVILYVNIMLLNEILDLLNSDIFGYFNYYLNYY